MPVWQWVLDAVGVLLALTLAYGIALIVRRRWLSRHGGTFELSYRQDRSRPGRGWVLGIGRYNGEALEWFRIFTLDPRPRRTWCRERLVYSGRRAPEGPEQLSLYEGHVVVTCTLAGAPVELAMSEASLTGFQAWLEAGPPGTDWTRGR